MDRQKTVKLQLDGLILLYLITIHRVGGSERRRTRLLGNILGKYAYKRVIITTTMWDDIGLKNGWLESRLGAWDEMTAQGA